MLELQELAGNRAVSELLSGQPPGTPAPSAGLRVRDLLRGLRPSMPVTAQRIPVASEKDDKLHYGEQPFSSEKSIWEEKLPYGEQPVSSEKEAWADKAASGEKASGTAAGTPMLAVGSAGPSVIRLQGLLVAAGFTVTPDGVFGPRTRAAVVSFQASRGLAPDGIVGPRTWGDLQASGSAQVTEGPGGLVAPGEMELVGPGPAMEKEGSVEGGGGEATLPDPDLKKKGEEA